MTDQHQEIEPALVTSVPKSILWADDSRPADYSGRAAIDAETAQLRDEIRNDHRSDLERLFCALAATLTTRRYVVPFFLLGNGQTDGTVAATRNLANFPDAGQWVLESIVAWADPAASADVQANVSLDQALAIPIPVKCAKAAAAPILLGGIPVMEQDTVKVTTSGGVATDRAAVLLIFKREG